MENNLRKSRASFFSAGESFSSARNPLIEWLSTCMEGRLSPTWCAFLLVKRTYFTVQVETHGLSGGDRICSSS